MKQTKLQRAEYLFRELSGVDERYLAQALQVREKRAWNGWRRAMLLAACLALSFTLCFSAILLNNRKDGDNMSGDFPQANITGDGAEKHEAIWKLDAILQNSEGMSGTRFDEKSFDFFTGERYVVWQYQDDTHFYRSRSLSAKEIKMLCDIASGNMKKSVSADGEPRVRVWVVEADGTVWTPYLQYTDGNLSAAAFFDYHAEIVPSDDWIDCVSDLIFD